MTVAGSPFDDPVFTTAVVTLPRVPGARATAQQLAAGGPIDAALIDCSAMEASSQSMGQGLIAQLIDTRGARWIQLIESTPFGAERVRAEMARRGMAGTLSIVAGPGSPH